MAPDSGPIFSYRRTGAIVGFERNLEETTPLAGGSAPSLNQSRSAAPSKVWGIVESVAAWGGDGAPNLPAAEGYAQSTTFAISARYAARIMLPTDFETTCHKPPRGPLVCLTRAFGLSMPPVSARSTL